MAKLKTISTAILTRCEKIYHKSDILKVIKEYNDLIKKVNVSNAFWYLSRHGYIKRIFLDYYYINSIEEREEGYRRGYEDKELIYLVLNKVKWKWYVGLTSALYESREILQVPNNLTIINNKISKNLNILGINVKFIKMKENLFFGLISKKTKNNINYSYSDTEKTDIDFIYLRRHNQISNKNKKTLEYMKRYPKWLKKLI